MFWFCLISIFLVVAGLITTGVYFALNGGTGGTPGSTTTTTHGTTTTTTPINTTTNPVTVTITTSPDKSGKYPFYNKVKQDEVFLAPLLYNQYNLSNQVLPESSEIAL